MAGSTSLQRLEAAQSEAGPVDGLERGMATHGGGLRQVLQLQRSAGGSRYGGGRPLEAKPQSWPYLSQESWPYPIPGRGPLFFYSLFFSLIPLIPICK